MNKVHYFWNNVYTKGMKLFRLLVLGGASIALAMLFSMNTYAQAGPAPCGQAGQAPCTTTSGTRSFDSSFDLKIKLNNPLKVNTIQDAVRLFVNGVVRLAIPVLVIFYIYAGFSFIAARGNTEKIKNAKSMFFYTIIGTILILGAWAITNAIVGTVNSIIE